ncbi:MAG: sugar transferase, partial [Desulfobulbaceae bacterium]|nr:sugar transferase [Desulfobulbaceae bacterium]
MLREKSHLLRNIHKALDILLVATAFISAYFIKKYLLPGELKSLATDPNYYLLLLLTVSIYYLTFKAFSFYVAYRLQSFYDIFYKIIKSVVVGILVLSFLLYLIHYYHISRLLLGIFALLLISLLTISKAAIYYTLK